LFMNDGPLPLLRIGHCRPRGLKRRWRQGGLLAGRRVESSRRPRAHRPLREWGGEGRNGENTEWEIIKRDCVWMDDEAAKKKELNAETDAVFHVNCAQQGSIAFCIK
jgi:hypothetical protein